MIRHYISECFFFFRQNGFSERVYVACRRHCAISDNCAFGNAVAYVGVVAYSVGRLRACISPRGFILRATMFGRVVHLVVDAMLISVVLSGIKRNTGLTLSLARIPNRDVRKFFSAYLEAGEWVRR